MRILAGTSTLLALFLLVLTTASMSQPKWQRTAPTTVPDLSIFHASKSMGLPTAETPGKGDFEFEISHRFFPPLTDGLDALYGFDGPTNMRLALGYGLFNSLVITLGRSNVDDNVDLWVKYRAIQLKNETVPVMISLRGGAAWNIIVTRRFDDEGNLHILKKKNKHHFQYYGQVIVDFMIMGRVAIGIVPSYVINKDIRLEDFQNAFMLGTHAQIYFSRMWSAIAEWSPILSGKDNMHNSAAFGLELETGAHIFQLYLSNQVKLNPAQYIAGSDFHFDADNLRLGFMISRLL